MDNPSDSSAQVIDEADVIINYEQGGGGSHRDSLEQNNNGVPHEGVGIDTGTVHLGQYNSARICLREYKKLKKIKIHAFQQVNELTAESIETQKKVLQWAGKIMKNNPGSYCKRSLFIFKRSGPIRRRALALATNKWFDYIVTAVIFINVFFLALDDPQAPDDDRLQVVINNINDVIVIFFAFEMIIKIIAFGLILESNTYLREGWNVMDFVINIVSIIGLIPGIGRFNAFRTFRVLRLLSINKKLKGLQIIVNSLVKSIGSLANISLLIGFLFTIYAIFATQMWMGLLSQNCMVVEVGYDNNGTWVNVPEEEILQSDSLHYLNSSTLGSLIGNHTLERKYINDPNDPNVRICTLDVGMYTCPNGTVCTTNGTSNPGNGFLSFDSFGWSFLAVFSIISLDGWSGTMYSVQDGYSQWAWIYFVLVVVSVTMFGVQLMLAVIATEFDNQVEIDRKIKKERALAKNALLKDILQGKAEGQKNETKKERVPPSSTWRTKVREIVQTKAFEYTLTIIIIFNLICLSLVYYEMPSSLSYALEIANYIFTIIFFSEMVLKVTGFGWAIYFSDHMNKFDFVIVVSSVVEIILDLAISVRSGLIVLRTFRLFRVFKLARSWKGLQSILSTVLRSLSSVIYLTLLMVIFIVIFALAGRQLFAGKMGTPDTAPRYNYDTLWRACLTTFQLFTGDGFTSVLFSLMLVNPIGGGIFACVCFALGQYILVSLFVGVLLSKFEDSVPSLVLVKNPITGESHLVEATSEDSSSSGDFLEDKPENVLDWSEDLNIKKTLKDKIIKFDDVTGRIRLKKTIRNRELEGTSLFLFSKDNLFRKFLWSIINFEVRVCWDKKQKTTPYNLFECFIVLVISGNIISLIIEHSLNENEFKATVLANFEYVFATVYIVEMVIKIICFGFYCESQRTYLKNKWNIIDFVVVLLSIFSFIFPEVRFLKSLRSIRILQLLSRSPETRVAVKAIGQAIPAVWNVFIILLLFWYIFAVIGVNSFGGQFYSCNDGSVSTRSDCTGFYIDSNNGNSSREWTSPPENFDNVGNALLTLFQIATLANWVGIMAYAEDATGVDNQPVQYNNEIASLYFVCFVIVGSFFTLNLFTSMVIHHFKTIRQQESGSKWLTNKQRRWVQAQAVLHLTTPEVVIKNPYDKMEGLLGTILSNFHHFVKSDYFDYSISLCILINTIVLAIPYYQMDESINFILEKINLALLAVFTMESILKIIAFGPQQYFGPDYFSASWNKFDFLIVVGSIIGTVVGGSNAIVINVVRLFRIARIIRLINKLEGLRSIFTTFIRSVPFIGNIMTIVLTVYFVFGVIGVSLMRGISYEFWDPGALNYWANFNTLPTAVITLFRLSTFDSWPAFARSASGFYCTPGPGIVCGESWYMLYFVLFLVIQTSVILNLFLAVLIENFTEFLDNDAKVTTDEKLKKLKQFWPTLDPRATGFMKITDLVTLMLVLPEPLGFPRDILQSEMIKEFEKMNLHLYNKNEINFYDLVRGLSIRSLNVDLKEYTNLKVLEYEKGRSKKTVAEYYRKKKEKFAKVTEEEIARRPEYYKVFYKGDNFFYQNDKAIENSSVSGNKEDEEEVEVDSEDIQIVVDQSNVEGGDGEAQSEELSEAKSHRSYEHISSQENEEMEFIRQKQLKWEVIKEEKERRTKRREAKVKIARKIQDIEQELEEINIKMLKNKRRKQKKKQLKERSRLKSTE